MGKKKITPFCSVCPIFACFQSPQNYRPPTNLDLEKQFILGTVQNRTEQYGGTCTDRIVNHITLDEMAPQNCYAGLDQLFTI